MKVRDFKFIEGYGYLKIGRVVMQYNTSEDLDALLKAAQKFGLSDPVLLRIYHRFNKLRSREERKDLFGG